MKLSDNPFYQTRKRAKTYKVQKARPCAWPKSYYKIIEETERALLVKALTETGGIIARAARQCGLAPSTMFMLIQRHGINPEDYRF